MVNFLYSSSMNTKVHMAQAAHDSTELLYTFVCIAIKLGFSNVLTFDKIAKYFF